MTNILLKNIFIVFVSFILFGNDLVNIDEILRVNSHSKGYTVIYYKNAPLGSQKYVVVNEDFASVLKKLNKYIVTE